MPDNSTQSSEPRKGAIRRFLEMSPDKTPKTIFVAVTLCLAASMVVSSVAVVLRPVQEVNKLRDKQINVLEVAGVYEPGIDVADAFSAFEPHVLELATGRFSSEFDAATSDDKAAADDPALSIELTDDPASIGRQSRYRVIYLLRDADGAVDKVVLPIRGYGLWSTLYGFIAIEENGNDIYGLQFYEHGETPGLGAEVDNPRWKALWRDKKLLDSDGNLAITVSKTVPPAGAQYHVDSLSGATLTATGVDNLVRFWMGDAGYRPFLDNLKSGDI
ncbi:MAG: Na(+)-translocating NADH-quinone reductase subunit C [Pseudomonadota bacterium]